MRNFNQNQLQLDLAFETKKVYKKSKPNPFTTSEVVKRILFKRGYSHIFNYPDYKHFKDMAKNIPSPYRAGFIADLFIENTSDLSDYDEYLS